MEAANYLLNNGERRGCFAVVQGDFDTAVTEMKLAVVAAPESLKPQHVDLVRRLENKEDINK